MSTLNLSAYKPLAGGSGDAGQIASGFSAIEAVVNALDASNFAAGLIFDPAKLMQKAATAGQAIVWGGSTYGPGGADPTKFAQGGAAANQALVWTGSAWAPATVAGAASTSTPADPTRSSSASDLMFGLAGAITPVGSGKVLIVVTGKISGNLTNSTGTLRIATGTGSAPANAAAATGTSAGVAKSYGAQGLSDFAINALATGLTPGTPYWIDLHGAFTLGAGGVDYGPSSVTITAIEA